MLSITKFILMLFNILVFILILVDMLVNYLTLVTQHDYVSFIVFFNAGLILLILLIDSISSSVSRFRRNYQLGQGISDIYGHEHPWG